MYMLLRNNQTREVIHTVASQVGNPSIYNPRPSETLQGLYSLYTITDVPYGSVATATYN